MHVTITAMDMIVKQQACYVGSLVVVAVWAFGQYIVWCALIRSIVPLSTSSKVVSCPAPH